MESALEDQICAIIWVDMLSILNFPRAAVLLIKKYPLTTPSKNDQPCNMTTATPNDTNLFAFTVPASSNLGIIPYDTLCFQASHCFAQGFQILRLSFVTSLEEEESSTNVFASLTTLLKDLGSVKEPLAGFVSVLVAPFARFRILWYYAQSWTSSNSMPDVWAW